MAYSEEASSAGRLTSNSPGIGETWVVLRTVIVVFSEIVDKHSGLEK